MRRSIAPSAVRHDGGTCWIVDLPDEFEAGDDMADMTRSTWSLLEDGRPLRFPHAYHNDVRHIGRGRFSHWGRRLYFSSSDNSPPADNGRSYVLTREPVAHPVGSGPATTTPLRTLFIVGCGHSGSTLLFNLFKPHPEIVPTNGYPDGEDHDGWIAHGDAPIAGFGIGGTARALTGGGRCLALGAADATPDRIERTRRHYRDEVLWGDTASIALNKNPHLSNKLPFVAAVFPEARFIHLVRDVAAVTDGWLGELDTAPERGLYWPDVPDPCFWTLSRGLDPDFPVDPERIIARTRPRGLVEYWAATNSLVDAFAAARPGLVERVRYEDLCRDRGAVLNRLCAFAGLSPFATTPAYPPMRPASTPSAERTAERVALDPRVSELRERYGYD